MNYTGFGSDPSYLYSFRPQTSMNVGMGSITSALEAPDPIATSMVYRQSGGLGKRIIEGLRGSGLPLNVIDPFKAQKVGYDTSMQRPIFRTPRPQPWGTWGPLSAGDVSDTGPFKDSTYREQEKRKAKIQNIINAPEPSQKETPKGYVRNRYGYLEPKEWYTEEGKKMTEEEYKKSKTTGKKESQLSTNTNMPQFDLYSSYSPLLQSPSLNFPYL